MKASSQTKSSKTFREVDQAGSLLLLAVVACVLLGCGGGGGGGDSANPNSAGSNSATLTWDPVMAANGYRVYYGTSPGTYVQPLQVGNVTSFTVTGLNHGMRYYFTATAFDAANNESAFSNEVFKDIP